MFISYDVKSLVSMPNSSALLFKYASAIVALSFITSPRFPVTITFPLPLLIELSINKISPPTGVQASPVTTPA